MSFWSWQVKVGDLIRDNGDNDLGLVLSEPRSYNLGETGAEYVMVQWSLYGPQKMVLKAIREGWVEIVNEAEEIHREETTNR
jgi:hypothetical protein